MRFYGSEQTLACRFLRLVVRHDDFFAKKFKLKKLKAASQNR
nr:Uncharacterised protein [Salmonella sp. NCTC 7297]